VSVSVVLFYVYALVAIAGAVWLVIARDLVHAVMSLFATLIALAALFLLLGSQSLAAMQLFIYGGAITVLVLFVLMFTGANREGGARSSRAVQLTALAICLGFFVLLAVAFVTARWQLTPVRGESVNAVALLLFSRLAIPFEIAGLALTVALIGSIVLAREDDVPVEIAMRTDLSAETVTVTSPSDTAGTGGQA